MQTASSRKFGHWSAWMVAVFFLYDFLSLALIATKIVPPEMIRLLAIGGGLILVPMLIGLFDCMRRNLPRA